MTDDVVLNVNEAEMGLGEEEDPGCESSRGKESKFIAERSDTGMVLNDENDANATGGNNCGSDFGIDDSGSAGAAVDGNAGSNSSSGNINANGSNNPTSRERGLGRSRYRVPGNLCRDYIFYVCKRKDCKFSHPEYDTDEYKDARASRPDLVLRDKERDRDSRGDYHRDRSRSPIGGDAGDHGNSGGSSSNRPMVCRDFLRNLCYRGKDCKYAHPVDGPTEELPWPQLCIDYRSGACKRANCRFMHYRNEDGEYYLQTGAVSKDVWQQFVGLTLRDTKILKSRPVCKLFLMSGNCTMDVCRYRHVTQKEYEDDVYYILLQMVYENVRSFNPDLPPPNRTLPPPRDGELPPMPPPPMHRKLDGAFRGPPPPLAPPPPFRSAFDHPDAGDLRADLGRSRGGDFRDWERAPPFGGAAPGFPKPPPPADPAVAAQVEQMARENSEMRRIMAEDSARFKIDNDRLNMENARLQEQLNFAKNNPADQTVQVQQLNLLQQENAEYLAKIKSINDWSVELQAKYSTARREGEELRDSVKVLNLELATVSDEKVKAKRKVDELEAKLQVAQTGRDEANLAVEKKEYLETKMKQYYEAMKRCEAEFASILEKHFLITTPNVMSYFPSWGYLMSYVTEIVTQINSLGGGASAVVSAPPPVSSYSYSNSSSVAAAAAAAAVAAAGYPGLAVGNYSMPPPSVTAATAASLYGAAVTAPPPTNTSYTDYAAVASQYPGSSSAAAAAAAAVAAAQAAVGAAGVGAAASANSAFGASGFYGAYGSGVGASSALDSAAYNGAASHQYSGVYGGSGVDKSRSSSVPKKDSLHHPPPSWKNRT